MTNLETRLSERSNSLNAIRLILAGLVVVSHAWPLHGRGEDPSLGGFPLGGWAVCAFFVISGVLITRSRERLDGARYFWNRFYRIVPAFMAVLLGVSIVLAPLTAALRGKEVGLADIAGYALRNLALYPPGLNQPHVGTSLDGLPYPGVWNGPLWTLFWEGLAYLAIGLLFAIVKPKAINRILSSTLVLLLLGLSVTQVVDYVLPELVVRVAPLTISFLVGSLAYLNRSRVRVDLPMVIAAIVVLVLLGQTELTAIWLGIPLFFIVFWVAFNVATPAFFTKHDLSYGMYIAGWPIQMIVIMLLGSSTESWLGFTASLLITLTVTAGVAFISWRYLEAPALAYGAARGIAATVGEPK